MKKEDGLVVLTEVVKNNKKHQDYKRVTTLADKYFKLVTGNGIEKLLQQIITRETEDEFKQRTNITKSVCPAILNSTKLPFQKAARKQPIVRNLDFEGDSDTQKQKLEEYISKYWGDKSLEKYLEYAFIDYNFTDPNAFLITEFAAFNPLKEKAKPYPFVATSEEAIMFEYHNEILDYLIVKLPIKYLDKESQQDGFKYTMYLGMDTIEFIQVSEDQKLLPEIIEIEKKYYLVTYYEPKNDKVPAMRFGFIRDTETKGRTFISVFHNVLAYLEKTLKIDSELDLSTAMVAFPQRFAYVSPCQNQGCNKGVLLDGTGECPVCHGTGQQPMHRGTQDVVTLTLPREPADIIDLERMLVYKAPPIELLTFQRDYIEYLKKSVHAMMFNADLFTRSEVSVTATEKTLETDNMNDTLFPFARQYSSMWEFTVKDIATFTDMSGVMPQHKFPSDFKMKSLNELMTELKMAKDAGASTSTIAAIEDDINEILYSDRPDALKEIRIKNLINPFRGYSEADIRFIISQNNVPLYNRTLWENFESIFQELETENQDPWLFDLAYDKILELVRAKTEDYVQRIKDETPEPVIDQPFGGQ
jgi:DNA-binding XRE family transcriptional regulator